ncbi:MAG: YdeI/OmpD-associated family protein [Anaerolineae bacterium]|nr:MAG: YdeI/OmpD-associated family protein [Anaerolineae bacterium]
MNLVEVKNRAEWRAWLGANHDKEVEAWLVYYKKKTGKTSVEYGASVEEALCYGWVDSIIKKLDDTKYARKFTPRKENSKWSPSNKNRVEQMISEGLMTEHGLQKVEAAKRSGNWDNPVQKPELTYEMPAEFAEELRMSKRAQETFVNLAPTYQKQYLAWIEVAKRPETREKRIKESIRLLAEGKKLGLR